MLTECPYCNHLISDVEQNRVYVCPECGEESWVSDFEEDYKPSTHYARSFKYDRTNPV